MITHGETFPPINLDTYLNEPNGDEVLWSYYFPQTLSNGEVPDWTINPSDFAFNMSMTTKVKVRGIYPNAATHKLAAFHNGELRGVATPSNLTGEWLYSLTIYSNQSQDSIYFKYFHDDQSTIFAVDDSVRFISQQIIGNINEPFEMEAGYISVAEEGHFLHPSIIDKGWTGSDTVYVIAQELGTINNYADTARIIFRVASGSTLPVDLLSFKGQKRDRRALLFWEIANPENVEGYEVQRAKLNDITGELEWDDIGFISHSDEKERYDFLDNKPNLSENYYRLRMIDFDETFSYSPIIHLDFSMDYKNEISFYPNPTFGDPFFLELNTATSDLVTIEIVDAAARIMTNIILYSDSNRQIIPLNMSHYPVGIYYAKIKIGHRRTEELIMVAGE